MQKVRAGQLLPAERRIVATLFDKTLAADTATIDTGADGYVIDPTYGDLEIFIYARTSEAVNASTLLMTLNADSSAIYDRAFINMTNATVSGGNSISQTLWTLPCAGNNLTAGVFEAIVGTMPNYAGTVGHKYLMMNSGRLEPSATVINVLFEAFGYRSTNPVSRISITAGNGSNFKAGTRFRITATGSV